MKKRNSRKCSSASRIGRHKLMFGQVLSSDDSEDSDYEQAACGTKRKKVIETESEPVKKKLKSGLIPPQSISVPSLNWSHFIPGELLFKIFSLAVRDISASPFLSRVSQVCCKWHDVASHPSLWCRVNLSHLANTPKANDETLVVMKERKILKNVKHVTLDGWQKLTSLGLEVIAQECPELETINLSRCQKVTAKGISHIAHGCKKLTSINLSNIQTDATSNSSIKKFIHENGYQLKQLSLAGNTLTGTPVLLAIQCCHHLKVLDISFTSISSFNVEKLQLGCPYLVELRMSQLSLQSSVATADVINTSKGFPDLELLSLSNIHGGEWINDRLLQGLLKTSRNLRQLDLRGCEKITHHCLDSLPAVSLEQLLLSRCKMIWQDVFRILNFKWQDSLKELDVSWCSHLNDNSLLPLCTATCKTALAKLDLSGTAVATLGLRNILNTHQGLYELNLTSCRGVPRGQKQLHHDVGIRNLRRQLQTSRIL